MMPKLPRLILRVDLIEEKKSPVSAAIVKRLVREVCGMGLKRSCSLSVVVTGDGHMRRLNSRFLKKKSTTDVLVFDLTGSVDQCRNARADIFVNAQAAVRMARQMNCSPAQEFIRYVIHGCLHLCGYDDHTTSQKKKMWQKQERWVRRFMAR